MIGRRRRARCIGFDPIHLCFKPCGVRGRGLETIELQADELEALRLMDYEGLYQAECAERMGISRTTLSRTLAEARRKVADALLHGKRLVIARAPEMFSIDSQVAGAPQSQTMADSANPQNEPLREDLRMKTIVLAANDDLGLDGEMAQHFGRCPYYVVVRVNGDQQVEQSRIEANPHAQQHGPGEVPKFVHSLGADVILAPGMGQKAIAWFDRLGVEVATGSRGQVGATLQAYLDGAISGATGCKGE
jgi:predicted DNA-binding protein (UPF0251 family)/predicted Fe-Mo cluster-binding NifX family protein